MTSAAFLPVLDSGMPHFFTLANKMIVPFASTYMTSSLTVGAVASIGAEAVNILIGAIIKGACSDHDLSCRTYQPFGTPSNGIHNTKDADFDWTGAAGDVLSVGAVNVLFWLLSSLAIYASGIFFGFLSARARNYAVRSQNVRFIGARGVTLRGYPVLRPATGAGGDTAATMELNVSALGALEAYNTEEPAPWVDILAGERDAVWAKVVTLDCCLRKTRPSQYGIGVAPPPPSEQRLEGAATPADATVYKSGTPIHGVGWAWLITWVTMYVSLGLFLENFSIQKNREFAGGASYGARLAFGLIFPLVLPMLLTLLMYYMYAPSDERRAIHGHALPYDAATFRANYIANWLHGPFVIALYQMIVTSLATFIFGSSDSLYDGVNFAPSLSLWRDAINAARLHELWTSVVAIMLATVAMILVVVVSFTENAFCGRSACYTRYEPEDYLFAKDADENAAYVARLKALRPFSRAMAKSE